MAASGETGGRGHQRNTGAKRSCDFNRERSDADEEGDFGEGSHVEAVVSPWLAAEEVGREPGEDRRGQPEVEPVARTAWQGRGLRKLGCQAAAGEDGLHASEGEGSSGRGRDTGSGKRCASPRLILRARVGAAGNENAGGGRRQWRQCHRLAGDCPGRPSSRRSGTAPWSRWIRIPSATITAATPR
jgi:hypothetical protein